MMVSFANVDERFVIERGGRPDYQALSIFHYKADDPGVATTVHRCRFTAPTVVGRFLARRDAGQVVGVQVVSMPHAGCTMRDYATGGRYRGVDLTTGTIMLNREMRTLSRTIVHPQFRGSFAMRSTRRRRPTWSRSRRWDACIRSWSGRA